MMCTMVRCGRCHTPLGCVWVEWPNTHWCTQYPLLTGWCTIYRAYPNAHLTARACSFSLFLQQSSFLTRCLRKTSPILLRNMRKRQMSSRRQSQDHSFSDIFSLIIWTHLSLFSSLAHSSHNDYQMLHSVTRSLGKSLPSKTKTLHVHHFSWTKVGNCHTFPQPPVIIGYPLPAQSPVTPPVEYRIMFLSECFRQLCLLNDVGIETSSFQLLLAQAWRC